MTGTVSPIESAESFRGALELSDKLAQENAKLRTVVTDLVYAYQDPEGGWDRMEAPIRTAKEAVGLVPMPDGSGRALCPKWCDFVEAAAESAGLSKETQGKIRSALRYDSKCQDLAEHFLSDAPPTAMSLAQEKQQVEDLASSIQQAVEDWFAARER